MLLVLLILAIAAPHTWHVIDVWAAHHVVLFVFMLVCLL